MPDHLCAADLALALGVDTRRVYRLAHRYHWRRVKRPGHREVYYHMDDVRAWLDKIPDPVGSL